MILEVNLRNIGPFKNRVSFTMIPTEYGGKRENLYTFGEDKHVLKVGIVYGANGSGKTNFILALYRLREELRAPKPWVSGTGFAGLYNPFLLDTETNNSESEISVSFTVGRKMFKYTVVFNKMEYLREELLESDQMIFIREGQNKAHHTVSFSAHASTKTAPRFATVPRNQMVLSQYLAYAGQGDIISDAAQYLANIQIANGYHYNMRNVLWEEVKHWISIDRKKHGQQLATFLGAVDISVNGFGFPQKDDAPFDKIVMKHKLYSNGKVTSNLTDFPIERESQGTKWLLLLGAKVIESLEWGLPLFVDELDACYHSQVTEFIIEMFRNPKLNHKGAQLIMTTHNANLMDERKMRSDQIWFIQKDLQGVAEMYSLSEFDGITENTPFADWYYARRFGGTPNLKSISGLFDPSDSNNNETE